MPADILGPNSWKYLHKVPFTGGLLHCRDLYTKKPYAKVSLSSTALCKTRQNSSTLRVDKGPKKVFQTCILVLLFFRILKKYINFLICPEITPSRDFPPGILFLGILFLGILFLGILFLGIFLPANTLPENI